MLVVWQRVHLLLPAALQQLQHLRLLLLLLLPWSIRAAADVALGVVPLVLLLVVVVWRVVLVHETPPLVAGAAAGVAPSVAGAPVCWPVQVARREESVCIGGVAVIGQVNAFDC